MPRLTKRTVDALTARPGEDLVVFDDQLAGFGVRVRPSGIKTYFIQYRNVYGRSRRYRIGRHGVLAPYEARVEAKKLLASVIKGEDPAALRERAHGMPTVSEFAKEYLSKHVDIHNKPSTRRHVRTDLKNHILPALGSKAVAEIAHADIEKLHRRLAKTPNAANRTVRVLSKMMTVAEAWGYRTRGTNPVVGVKKYRENHRERFLSLPEVARLGTAIRDCAARGEISFAAASLLRLLCLTGCRKNEIIGLRWEEVNLEAGFLFLSDSKTGPKAVPLAAPAAGILSTMPKTSSYVFPSPKLPGRPYVEVKRAWSTVVARAALKDLRIHDLRHTHASVGAAAGLSLPAIGKLLGHRQVSTTARYAHLVDDPLREAAERVQDRIASALDNLNAGVAIPLRLPGSRLECPEDLGEHPGRL